MRITANPNVDLSGVTFNNWTSGSHTIIINGTTGDNTLFGSSQIDIIRGGLGVDIIVAGAGNDTVFFDTDIDIDFIDGGSDADTIDADGFKFLGDVTFNLAADSYFRRRTRSRNLEQFRELPQSRGARVPKP